MNAREFYQYVAEVVANDEVKAYAYSAIKKLDSKNEKRRNTPTKSQLENEQIKVKILAYLAGCTAPALASEIAKMCDLSTQKVSALVGQLVANGKATSVDVKVKGKGTLKGYSIVNEVDEVDEVDN